MRCLPTGLKFRATFAQPLFGHRLPSLPSGCLQGSPWLPTRFWKGFRLCIAWTKSEIAENRLRRLKTARLPRCWPNSVVALDTKTQLNHAAKWNQPTLHLPTRSWQTLISLCQTARNACFSWATKRAPTTLQLQLCRTSCWWASIAKLVQASSLKLKLTWEINKPTGEI